MLEFTILSVTEESERYIMAALTLQESVAHLLTVMYDRALKKISALCVAKPILLTDSAIYPFS